MKWPQACINEGEALLQKVDFTHSTPNKENVLNFLRMDPSMIRIVIIGQDPYPTAGVANGYAFAVNKGTPLPESLKNIFQEIRHVRGVVHTDETLQHWVQQGVLLLNASLTTVIGQPNAHRQIWQDYTQKVIRFLDHHFPNIKWVLWGAEARRVASNVQGAKIIDAHPSPLSVYRRSQITFKVLPEINW